MGTVLIIGASRGIGHELARQYLQAGQRVIATGRDESALQALRDMGAQPLRLDVADAASISALAWQLDGERIERIERAWHVAGVMCSRANALQVPSQAEFDRVMHTNQCARCDAGAVASGAFVDRGGRGAGGIGRRIERCAAGFCFQRHGAHRQCGSF